MSIYPYGLWLKLRVMHPLTVDVAAVFLPARQQLLCDASWYLSYLSLSFSPTAIVIFDQPCWTQSSTFINRCHWTLECAYLRWDASCTLHFIISRGMKDWGLWGVTQEKLSSHNNSLLNQARISPFFLFFLFYLLLYLYCSAHYALMRVWRSRKPRFDSAPPHYWQESTWEMRCILTPGDDSHLH